MRTRGGVERVSALTYSSVCHFYTVHLKWRGGGVGGGTEGHVDVMLTCVILMYRTEHTW